LTLILGNFLKFYGGWGIQMAVFESCFLKIGIAGVEQCLCGRMVSTYIWVGGGRVGVLCIQKQPRKQNKVSIW